MPKNQKPQKPKRSIAPQPQREHIETAYVAYPGPFKVPTEELSSLPNTYLVGPYSKFIFLEEQSADFEKTRNPFAALQALVAAHRAGVYPPIEVLKFFATAIENYLDGNDGKDLAHCLGLIGGRGVPNFFETRERSIKEFMSCLDILIWKKLFGLKIETACKLLARSYGNQDSTIQRYYSGGEWKLHKKHAEDLFVRARLDQEWDEQRKRSFVSKYPYWVFEELETEIDESILCLHKDFPR